MVPSVERYHFELEAIEKKHLKKKKFKFKPHQIYQYTCMPLHVKNCDVKGSVNIASHFII